jgi:hypothetical protein
MNLNEWLNLKPGNKVRAVDNPRILVTIEKGIRHSFNTSLYSVKETEIIPLVIGNNLDWELVKE